VISEDSLGPDNGAKRKSAGQSRDYLRPATPSVSKIADTRQAASAIFVDRSGAGRSATGCSRARSKPRQGNGERSRQVEDGFTFDAVLQLPPAIRRARGLDAVPNPGSALRTFGDEQGVARLHFTSGLAAHDHLHVRLERT